MSIFEGDLFKAPKEWLAKVAVRRMVLGVAKFLASLLTSAAVVSRLQDYGIKIEAPAQLQTEIGTTIMAALVFIHDWLKVRFPDSQWL